MGEKAICEREGTICWIEGNRWEKGQYVVERKICGRGDNVWERGQCVGVYRSMRIGHYGTMNL